MANLAQARRRRNGSATVWLAISLVAVVGILALGMDGGRMMEERRRAQAAADAAALAGAKQGYDQLHQSPSRVPSNTNIIQAANQSLSDAGYVNDGISATLAVNVAPRSGQFKGNAAYVEVIVESQVKATFGRIFTGSDLVVRARAVARFQRKNLGLVVLDPTAAKALSVTANATLQVKDDSIWVDTSSSNAVYVASTASLVADALNIVGSILGGILGFLSALLGGVNTGVTPAPDPLIDLPPPNLSQYALCSGSCMSCGSSTTLQPGIYSGGIQVNGGTVTLSPGVYILDGGGLTVSGQAIINGNGVMIYNTGGGSAGPISIGGQASVILSAPSSGPYAGVCIFQDRACTLAVQLVGKGNLQIAGTIYAPAAKVQVNGNGTLGGTMMGCIVCGTLSAGGNGTIQLNIYADPPTTYQVRLVE
jgi:Flp pilus assembly protein TadG